MKRPSPCHLRLLVLLSLMLALATCGLLLASSLAGAAVPVVEQSSEVYDRVVPGMTRAEDLAGIGLTHPQTITAQLAAAKLAGHADRTVDACLAAKAWCTGYVLRQASGEAVLLVMDGRVVFKATV